MIMLIRKIKILSDSFEEAENLMNPDKSVEECRDCGKRFHSLECRAIHERNIHGYDHEVDFAGELIFQSDRNEVSA